MGDDGFRNVLQLGILPYRPAAEFRISSGLPVPVKSLQLSCECGRSDQVGGGGVATLHIPGLRDAAYEVVDFPAVGRVVLRDHFYGAGVYCVFVGLLVRCLVGGEHQVLQPVWARQAVGVGKDQPLAGGAFDGVVAGGIGAGGGAVFDAGVGWQLVGWLEGVGAVFDQHDFEFALRQRLRRQALEQVRDQVPVVVDGGDDGEVHGYFGFRVPGKRTVSGFRFPVSGFRAQEYLPLGLLLGL